MRRIARALGVSSVLVLAACGSTNHASPTTTAAVTVSKTVTVAPEPTVTEAAPAQAPAYDVYFLRNDKLAAVGRSGTSSAPARAAMAQLLAGPNAREQALGMTSAIPAGLKLTRLEIRNGVAIADFDPMVSPDSADFAQIVYTLTQFPTVKRVSIVLETQDAAEFSRKAVDRFVPPILVESPVPYEHASSPLRIRGNTNAFEAEFRYELRDAAGTVISSGGVTATAGSGQRGTFDKTISYSGAARELRVFELSAADGSRIHEVRVPLT